MCGSSHRKRFYCLYPGDTSDHPQEPPRTGRAADLLSIYEYRSGGGVPRIPLTRARRVIAKAYPMCDCFTVLYRRALLSLGRVVDVTVIDSQVSEIHNI